MDVQIQAIARMKSDFPTKFGIPRQSGLVGALESTIVFEPEFRNADALRALKAFPTCGLSGSFLRLSARAGRPPSGRPGWGATPGWGSSPLAPPSDPIT